MAVFVDTSGVVATLNPRDENHPAARARWIELLERDEILHTTNYAIVESLAVLSRRLGFSAVRAFQADVVPVLTIFWVDPDVHGRAVSALLTAGERHLSLVDCVSFEVMRRLDLDTAFAFDAHFAEQGFRSLPSA
ncbi:MAG: type II toxin-antitoxin system VapC family toxin [Chloroflexota bacterium]